MKNKSFSLLKYILLIYLSITILVPILKLFSTIKVSHITNLFTSPQFWPMLKNSLITTIIATIISVTISFLLAFALNRSRIRFKSIWVVLFTLPMLIPSISHGMGLVLLFGDNGILTNMLGINIELYGYIGIIMGSVIYSFPVSFLLFHDSFHYEDFTIYEAANILGIPKWNCFWKVTIPSMKQTIASAILAVFTMIFTDYGVPLTTGGKIMTLPVYMYREVIGMMDFSNGAIIGIVLLLPAIIAFIIDFKKNNNSTLSNTITKSFKVEKNKTRDLLIYIIFSIFLIFICLPIIAFICLSFIKQYPINMSFTFDNIKKLMSNKIGIYLLNSLSVALLTAFIGTCLSYLSAYLTTHSEQKISNKILHFISMLSLAIPGIVLGLSFALTFNNFSIYSTIYILLIVNIAHFFSSPYLLALNSLSKFSSNFEDVAKSLGISRGRMIFSVYIPSTIPTIIEMYSYYFVNAMITISAVSFVVSFKTMTLSLLIPQLESQAFIEGTAIVSLLILALNLIEKIISFFIKRSSY